jgi:hypothetical protein
MNLFKSLFNNKFDFSDFLDRNPEDKSLDEFMIQIQNMIRTDLSLKSVYLGYNLLTENIFDDPGWAFWGSANIGHTATMGFDKEVLDSVFAQKKPIYLCYVAIPIDSEDYLIEKDEMLDWRFEDYLKTKFQTNIVTLGALKKDKHERCRTFKFLYQKDEAQPDSNTNANSKFDLNNFRFLSSDHIRYENGVDNYGHQKGAHRGLEIVKHDSVQDAFKVTMYNMDGNHPVWGTRIQMHPKRMKIISQNNDKIELKGFGNDPLGVPFSSYGITLHLINDDVERVVLHMYDKKVDIEYFK